MKRQINHAQRLQLVELFFEFGNYGAKHSQRNHKFIQHLLVAGIDRRAFYRPTTECQQAVDKVLSQREAA